MEGDLSKSAHKEGYEQENGIIESTDITKEVPPVIARSLFYPSPAWKIHSNFNIERNIPYLFSTDTDLRIFDWKKLFSLTIAII